jgi:hypothetical protein
LAELRTTVLRQTVLGGVGALDGLRFGVEDLESGDWPEHFLLDDRRRDVSDLDQRRPDERAVALAPQHDVSVGCGVGNRAVNALGVARVDHRSHLTRRVIAGTHLDRRQGRGQPRPQLVGDSAFDEDPAPGHAELAGEGRDRRGEHGHGGIQVGVAEDDHGSLAAQFQGDRLESGRRCRHDLPADRGGAGVAEDVHLEYSPGWTSAALPWSARARAA